MRLACQDLQAFDLKWINEEVRRSLAQSHSDLAGKMSIPSFFIRERVKNRKSVVIKPHSIPSCRAWLLLNERQGRTEKLRSFFLFP